MVDKKGKVLAMVYRNTIHRTIPNTPMVSPKQARGWMQTTTVLRVSTKRAKKNCTMAISTRNIPCSHAFRMSGYCREQDESSRAVGITRSKGSVLMGVDVPLLTWFLLVKLRSTRESSTKNKLKQLNVEIHREYVGIRRV